MSQIISIVGRSSSGKTTLIEGLIRFFNKKGCSISIIKHIKHDFDIDYKGKDTHRYRLAGAFSSIITNDRMFAIISDIYDNMTPVDLANNFLSKSALVIIEGFREGDTPKIEVIGDSTEEPLFMSGVKNIVAIVSDRIIDSKLPLFKRNDIEGIGEFIEKLLREII